MIAQSLPDKILWTLNEHDPRMRRDELRRHTGLRMYEISSILEDLEKEGKIRIDGNIISLI